ncbi:MAG: gliding motility-associated C-terminal domain-containing protein [Bacteroidia bacterium]|nr:gliding motility-associated C-terminal domain-containing protein [Bacteroidia bacterium]
MLDKSLLRISYLFLSFLLVFFCKSQLSYTYSVQSALCNCNGSASVTITSGIAPYSYTLNGVPTSTNIYTSLCAGNYTLFVQDSNVPSDTVTIFFTILDSTFKSNIIYKDGCNSLASANISLSGGRPAYTHTLFPTNTTTLLTFSNLASGTYTFVAKDNAGCSITNTFAVNNYSAISNFSMSATNAKIGSTILFTNESLYGTGYLWDFGNGNTATSFDAAETYTSQGTYKVQLIVFNGTCSDTSYKYLFITDKLLITIPNIFTPNNDDINDLWYVSFEGATDMYLAIYNRYGVKLYENKGTGAQWDGRTLSGEPVPTGTYFYYLEVKDVLDNINKFKGTITLIR